MLKCALNTEPHSLHLSTISQFLSSSADNHLLQIPYRPKSGQNWVFTDRISTQKGNYSQDKARDQGWRPGHKHLEINKKITEAQI